jgi:hypothetical protein
MFLLTSLFKNVSDTNDVLFLERAREGRNDAGRAITCELFYFGTLKLENYDPLLIYNLIHSPLLWVSFFAMN